MKPFFISIVLGILIASCGGDAGPQMSAAEQTLSDAGFPVADSMYIGDYKRYTGTIANEDIVLNIVQYKGNIQAEYYYKKIGRNISLYKVVDSGVGTDVSTFVEYTPDNDGSSGKWQVRIFTDTIAGKWIDEDGRKSYDIFLTVDMDETIQRFSVVEVHDSARLMDSLADPHAEFKYTVLIPLGDSANSGFIKSVVLGSLKCENADSGNINICLQKIKEQYFDEYRNNTADDDMEFALSPMNNWSRDVGYSVVYNQDGFLVLDNHYYEYTGGAHGNYSSNFINIDRVNNKVLALDDIIKADTGKVLSLLEVQLRKRFGLNSKQPLKNYLFTNELHIPDNFYIGCKGITFVYGLYEIASYADGIIEVHIPYNKLSGILTPSFKQRMALEPLAKQQQ